MASGNSVSYSETRNGHHEHHRISKPDLFLAVAFWMQKSPLAERPSDYISDFSSVPKSVVNSSGAVVVLPNDRALSVDCSQGGVHAAVLALNKFGQERVKGCHVYLSRRPCSSCAKLLVQCEVAKVYYLPIEPEKDDEEDAARVDAMFLSSTSGLSIKVPKIDDSIFQDHRDSPYRGSSSVDEEGFANNLFEENWNYAGWVNRAKKVLRWYAFDGLKDQITQDIKAFFKWVAHVTVEDVPEDTCFELVKKTQQGVNYHDNKPKEDGPRTEQVPIQEGANAPQMKVDAPAPDSQQWQQLARHTSRLAQMLSQRSDDPARGVGCALMIHNSEIVAIGWNGFPAKALYGEFPRASDTDEERHRKEPYVIHAEQNALLTRNKCNLKFKNSVLFINEVPCAQCLPLLKQAGVDTLVIPKIDPNPGVNQQQIELLLKKKFVCYGSRRPETGPAANARQHVTRELQF